MQSLFALILAVAVSSVSASLNRRSYDHSCNSTAFASNGSYLVFDPPVMAMDDTDFYTNFTIALTTQPKGNVTVYLSADGFKFHLNTFYFSPSNWNQSQSNSVSPSPSLFPAGVKNTTFAITANVDAPCEVYNGCPQVYTGERTVHSPKNCALWGDPHIIPFSYYLDSGFGDVNTVAGSTDIVANFVSHTLADHGFTINAQGQIYAVYSEHLIVQFHSYPCGATVFCVGAVAIQYGDASIVLSIMDANIADLASATAGADNTVTSKFQFNLQPGSDPAGISYNPPDASNVTQSHVVNLKDGSAIVVNVIPMGSLQSQLDVVITLSGGYWDKSSGVCSKMSAPPGVFYLRDGTSFVANSIYIDNGIPKPDPSQVDLLTNSWKVPPEEDLFLGNVPPIGTYKQPMDYYPLDGAKGPANGNWSTVCGADLPPPQVYVEKNITYNTYVPQGYSYYENAPSNISTDNVFGYEINKPKGYVSPTKDTVDNAYNQCSSAITNPDCDAITGNSSRHYIHTCVEDSLSSGSNVYIEVHKVAYQSQCKSTSQGYISNPNPSVKAIGYGYKDSVDSVCKPDDNGDICSGHGQCTASGCQCSGCYTGQNCEKDTSVAPTIPPPTDQYPPGVALIGKGSKGVTNLTTFYTYQKSQLGANNGTDSGYTTTGKKAPKQGNIKPGFVGSSASNFRVAFGLIAVAFAAVVVL